MFIPFFYNYGYFLLMLPVFVLSVGASIWLQLVNRKQMRRPNGTGLTGAQAAQRIASEKSLPVSFQQVAGQRSDHYDPRNDTINLSTDVAQKSSIAAVAIAAHEMGHALQHHSGSPLMKFRNTLVPVVNIGSQLGYILIVIGFLLAFADLAWVGVALFSLTTVFSFLTLPIEIDASNRGMKLIRKLGLLGVNDQSGARKVLSAAALTYIAALASSLANLLYFVLQVSRLSDD